MTNSGRHHFRIQYPIANRPRLIIAMGFFEVIEVSERGLKIDTPARGFSLGDEFRGRLRFSSGKSITVVGKIIRKTTEQSVAILEKGIPLPIIMAEQSLLLRAHTWPGEEQK